MELIWKNGKILMRSSSAANSFGESDTGTIGSGSSASAHHIHTQKEDGHDKACGCLHHPEHLCSSTPKALALMAKLDSTNNNNKKMNVLTNCLLPRHHARDVCGENCSSSSNTIKLTNRDHISLAKLHTKSTPFINALTCRTQLQAAQPNSRLSSVNHASPHQQCNSVNDNFSIFTSSTKLELDTGTSLEPARTASSESLPCASVNPNKMNTKGYYQLTGDSKSHCNADGKPNYVDTVAPAKGLKRKPAAQVHKLSEKRRKDKINKRLRALQDLIPNCSKRDKVSLLDEAIDHLKSLQLHLQIMSMFAGLCVPSTQMMSHSPAYYPTIGSSIALTFGKAAGLLGPGTRFQMPIAHHQ